MLRLRPGFPEQAYYETSKEVIRLAIYGKDCNGCCPKCHGTSARARGGTGTCYGGCKGLGHVQGCEKLKNN